MVNFNRLRQVSLYATAAHAPGGETIVSIPGLILGDRVIDAKRTAPRTLMLTTASGNVSFSEPRNVFDDVRSLGLNTAIDGWYHPYGRLLSRGLTRCYWFPAWLRPELWPEPEASGLTELMLARMELQLVKMPGLGHFPMFAPTRSMRQAQVRGYQRWLRRAREYAADRSLGLVMLHVPVPHPPAIYSRARGTLSSEPGGSYLDNLALADRTLGDLRGLLEKDGLWDSTALLVTSDHGLRASVWNGMDEWSPAVAALAEADTTKVPFLFHLPRQAAAVRYDKPLNTLITRRLIVSFLRGEIRQPEQAAQFIGSLAAQP
jgi:hypothetical protein